MQHVRYDIEADPSDRFRWFRWLLVVLVVLCLALAAWVWFDILWLSP